MYVANSDFKGGKAGWRRQQKRQHYPYAGSAGERLLLVQEKWARENALECTQRTEFWITQSSVITTAGQCLWNVSHWNKEYIIEMVSLQQAEWSCVEFLFKIPNAQHNTHRSGSFFFATCMLHVTYYAWSFHCIYDTNFWDHLSLYHFLQVYVVDGFFVTCTYHSEYIQVKGKA